MEKHFEVKLVIFPKLYLADKPHLIKDYQEDIVGRIINWSGLSRMTNEMMVRRAKSAKIGKTLTAYLILGADGGGGGHMCKGMRHGFTWICVVFGLGPGNKKI